MTFIDSNYLEQNLKGLLFYRTISSYTHIALELCMNDHCDPPHYDMLPHPSYVNSRVLTLWKGLTLYWLVPVGKD